MLTTPTLSAFSACMCVLPITLVMDVGSFQLLYIPLFSFVADANHSYSFSILPFSACVLPITLVMDVGSFSTTLSPFIFFRSRCSPLLLFQHTVLPFSDCVRVLPPSHFSFVLFVHTLNPCSLFLSFPSLIFIFLLSFPCLLTSFNSE